MVTTEVPALQKGGHAPADLMRLVNRQLRTVDADTRARPLCDIIGVIADVEDAGVRQELALFARFQATLFMRGGLAAVTSLACVGGHSRRVTLGRAIGGGLARDGRAGANDDSSGGGASRVGRVGRGPLQVRRRHQQAPGRRVGFLPALRRVRRLPVPVDRADGRRDRGRAGEDGGRAAREAPQIVRAPGLRRGALNFRTCCGVNPSFAPHIAEIGE